jgi:hypothetical protein
MDVSADLPELSRCPVGLVSAGVKSILDIGRCGFLHTACFTILKRITLFRTLEYLVCYALIVRSASNWLYRRRLESRSHRMEPNISLRSIRAKAASKVHGPWIALSKQLVFFVCSVSYVLNVAHASQLRLPVDSGLETGRAFCRSHPDRIRGRWSAAAAYCGESRRGVSGEWDEQAGQGSYALVAQQGV